MTAPTPPDEVVSLREVVRVVLRYWWLAGGILLVTLALAGVYLVTAPTVFEGRATLQLVDLPDSEAWPRRAPDEALLHRYGVGEARLVNAEVENGRLSLVMEGPEREGVAARLETVIEETLAHERRLSAHMEALDRVLDERLLQNRQRLERLQETLDQSPRPDALGTLLQAENAIYGQLTHFHRQQTGLAWSRPEASVLSGPHIEQRRAGPGASLALALALALGGILAVVGAIAADNLFLPHRSGGPA